MLLYYFFVQGKFEFNVTLLSLYSQCILWFIKQTTKCKIGHCLCILKTSLNQSQKSISPLRCSWVCWNEGIFIASFLVCSEAVCEGRVCRQVCLTVASTAWFRIFLKHHPLDQILFSAWGTRHIQHRNTSPGFVTLKWKTRKQGAYFKGFFFNSLGQNAQNISSTVPLEQRTVKTLQENIPNVAVKFQLFYAYSNIFQFS